MKTSFKNSFLTGFVSSTLLTAIFIMPAQAMDQAKEEGSEKSSPQTPFKKACCLFENGDQQTRRKAFTSLRHIAGDPEDPHQYDAKEYVRIANDRSVFEINCTWSKSQDPDERILSSNALQARALNPEDPHHHEAKEYLQAHRERAWFGDSCSLAESQDPNERALGLNNLKERASNPEDPHHYDAKKFLMMLKNTYRSIERPCFNHLDRRWFFDQFHLLTASQDPNERKFAYSTIQQMASTPADPDHTYAQECLRSISFEHACSLLKSQNFWERAHGRSLLKHMRSTPEDPGHQEALGYEEEINHEQAIAWLNSSPQEHQMSREFLWKKIRNHDQNALNDLWMHGTSKDRREIQEFRNEL